MQFKVKAAAAAVAVVALFGIGTMPASAQTIGGSTSCASTQQQGVQSALSSNGTTTTVTVHSYANGREYALTGFGTKSSSNPGVSSGGWSAYSSRTLAWANGYCMPKAT